MENIKSKVLSCLICLLPFALLFIFAELFPTLYLLEWMLRRHFLYLWVAVIVVALINAKWGYALSFSYLTAIILAQVSGDYLRSRNIMKITVGMRAEEVARLQEHPGFTIWLGLFVLMLVSCGIFFKYQRVKVRRKD